MPAEEKDIIDIAMAGDDTDYGDKSATSDDQSTDTSTDDKSTDTPLQQTQTPQQSIQDKDPTATQQRAQPPADPNNPLGLKRVGAQYADKNGNIVDKDGRIIARAGEPARQWQEASRATAQVNNLTRQNTQLTEKLRANEALVAQAREIAELPKKLGISREDYNEGITLISNWTKNPVEVARDIVARTLALGHNVTDILGKSAGDALEMKAVSSLVRQATAPLLAQQEERARITQQNEQGQAAYSNFVSKYPDAETHAEAIAHQMGKGIDAEVAYHRLKVFALENGFDFSQPLGPQVQRLQNGGGTDQRNTGQQQRTAAPMVNGGRGNDRQTTIEPEYANPDDDWATILHGVMRTS